MQICYSCINDHGETCCLSAGAVNKRSYADKDSPPPLTDLLRYISNPNHVLFQCYFRVQWNRELNNEWRPPQYSHIADTFCYTLLGFLLDALGRKWGVNWSVESCKMRASLPGGLAQNYNFKHTDKHIHLPSQKQAFFEAVESLECFKSSFKQSAWLQTGFRWWGGLHWYRKQSEDFGCC